MSWWKKSLAIILVALMVLTSIPAISRAQEPTEVLHVVERGESLSLLAHRYQTTIEAIKARNNLSSDTIWANQLLVIPSHGYDFSVPIEELFAKFDWQDWQPIAPAIETGESWARVYENVSGEQFLVVGSLSSAAPALSNAGKAVIAILGIPLDVVVGTVLLINSTMISSNNPAIQRNLPVPIPADDARRHIGDTSMSKAANREEVLRKIKENLGKRCDCYRRPDGLVGEDGLSRDPATQLIYEYKYSWVYNEINPESSTAMFRGIPLPDYHCVPQGSPEEEKCREAFVYFFTRMLPNIPDTPYFARP